MLYKRILWISSAILFFVLAPLLIIYSLGWRYDFAKRSLQPTGILFVKTYPQQANIYLNDIWQDDRTPWQKANLLANDYHLKITQTGYLDWQKTINVRPQQTAFVEDIVLFKKLSPTIISEENNLQIISNNTGEIHIITGQTDQGWQMWNFVVDHKIWRPLLAQPINLPIKLISLSPNGKKLIYETGDEIYLLNINIPQNNSRLTDLPRQWFNDFAWHGSKDNIIYVLQKNTLLAYDITTSSAKLVASISNAQAYFPYQNTLYIGSEQTEDNQLLLSRYTDLKTEALPITKLPAGGKLQLIPSQRHLSVLDSGTNWLYLLGTDNNNFVAKVIPNVKHATWYSRNDDKLLYWNDNELSVYFADRDNSILLTRRSQTIHNAWWHPNGAYVFYLLDKELQIIELDERSPRNEYTLATLDDQSPLLINNKGDIIFYLNESGQLLEQIIQ
ncbi:MAG: PEGA domain-containing protein [Candidatus Komeilibacteria bacterium]